MNTNTDYMKTGSIEPAVLQDIYTLDSINILSSVLNTCVSTLDNISDIIFAIFAGAAVV